MRVLVGLAGAVLTVLLLGVGDRQVGIFELGGEPGSATLTMAVESCNQNPRVEVDETESQVRLTACCASGWMITSGGLRDRAGEDGWSSP